jgi:GAF domain-containing protein
VVVRLKERGRVPKALDETWQRLEDFADAARALTMLNNGVDVAEALCNLAVKVVGGDHASITSVRGGAATTVAATSHVPEQADKIQYATGQGPCLDAIREHDTFRVADLRTDPRWPLFGPQAAEELGVRSMLAHVLPVDDSLLAAVNVYSTRPDTFTAEHETLIAIIGATAVQSLGAAIHREKALHLEQALRTSRHIGVALGILMNSRGITLEQSWQILSTASQHRNIKVAALAERLISTGSLDTPW